MILCAVWYHLVSFRRTILITIAHPKRIKGSGRGEEVLFESAKAVGRISGEFVGFFAHTYIVQCYPMTYGVLFYSVLLLQGPDHKAGHQGIGHYLVQSWLDYSCLGYLSHHVFAYLTVAFFSLLWQMNLPIFPSLLFSSFVFPCLFDFKLNSTTNPLRLFCNKCNISWSVKNTHFVVVKVHFRAQQRLTRLGTHNLIRSDPHLHMTHSISRCTTSSCRTPNDSRKWK